MKTIATIYIDGQFVTPHGREPLVLLDPAIERETTTVILADEVDAQRAIAAAKAALAVVARTTREERMAWLQRLHDAVAAAEPDIVDVIVAEYGGTMAMAVGTARRAAASFAIARRLLFSRTSGMIEASGVPPTSRRDVPSARFHAFEYTGARAARRCRARRAVSRDNP